MSSAATGKEARGDERARQSARQTAERAARKKQPKPASAPRAKRGGPSAIRLDDDGADDVSSGTDTETEGEVEQRPAQAQEVPLAELVAQRISRKDTQESFELVSAAADRGVVALEDSAELPGPGEGWERVESRDAEPGDRPTYSDVAAAAAVKKA